MTTPANADELAQVHQGLTAWALRVLSGTPDADGNVVHASAAEIAVIRAFLKDNNITAAPARGNALEKLQQKLAERQRGSRPQRLDPARDLGHLAEPFGEEGPVQ